MFLCPVTGSQASPPSALLKMTDGNSVQLQLRQERLRDGEIYDSHLGASSSGAGVPDRLQTVSELRTESPQRPDKLPPLIFLAFDLESEYLWILVRAWIRNQCVSNGSQIRLCEPVQGLMWFLREGQEWPPPQGRGGIFKPHLHPPT